MVAKTTGSRKANKERTRQRLIQATLTVLHNQGSSALTTGRIASEAGVAQPTFYVHFSSMEDALQQTAHQVANESLTKLVSLRDSISMGAPIDIIRAAFTSSIDNLLEQPKLTDLFLRHRRDIDSPLGVSWTEVTNKARKDLAEDLARISVPDAELFAEVIVGKVLTVTEGILEGRIKDRSDAIEMLVMMTTLTVNHYFEQREPSSAIIALDG